jgi:hypothetical protein
MSPSDSRIVVVSPLPSFPRPQTPPVASPRLAVRPQRATRQKPLAALHSAVALSPMLHGVSPAMRDVSASSCVWGGKEKRMVREERG